MSDCSQTTHTFPLGVFSASPGEAASYLPSPGCWEPHDLAKLFNTALTAISGTPTGLGAEDGPGHKSCHRLVLATTLHRLFQQLLFMKK